MTRYNFDHRFHGYRLYINHWKRDRLNIIDWQQAALTAFRTNYRVERSQLTHFKFEYSAGAIPCRGRQEGERKRRRRHFIWSVAMERWNVQQRVTCVRSFGDIAWPARSPDLTVRDIFLRGFLKDRVFRRRIVTLQELKQAIVDEIAAIDEDLRRRAYGNLQTRLPQCIDVNGDHLPDAQKISL